RRSSPARRSLTGWSRSFMAEVGGVLATDGRPSRGGRVFLRAPGAGDRNEFVSLMRASRSFHRPWATAPTDDGRFAAYLADAQRPDFEAMLVCRREDLAI